MFVNCFYKSLSFINLLKNYDGKYRKSLQFILFKYLLSIFNCNEFLLKIIQYIIYIVYFMLYQV